MFVTSDNFSENWHYLHNFLIYGPCQHNTLVQIGTVAKQVFSAVEFRNQFTVFDTDSLGGGV